MKAKVRWRIPAPRAAGLDNSGRQASNDGVADVFCLAGPTAAGKTALAVELARRRPLEIVSVDSAQVYRGMDIGTGKPDARTRALAPHRLIDIRDPSESYSAADFRADAVKEIRGILASSRTPLLVGGTMLYFRALRDGLARMPPADSGVRRKIEQQAASEGWEAIHRRLAEVDPEAAARIHPNDPQRLQRALEVWQVTGKTISSIHAERKSPGNGSISFRLHFFATHPPERGELHRRIDARFRAMLADGFVAEVERLHRRDDLHPGLPSMKSVGYRQVWQYLDGDLDYPAMVEKSIAATRQLAKRQLTWLRSWPGLRRYTGDPGRNLGRALKFVDSFTLW